MQESFNDRRKYKRAGVCLKAEYAVLNFIPQAIQPKKKEVSHEAVTANISEGGIQLVVESAPEPGQVLRLQLRPEGSRRINAFAKVKWAGYDDAMNRYRIGLEFYFLRDYDRALIRSIVS